jgi:hypothetical protein
MIVNNNLNTSWWALRVGLGLAAFLAGLDKYFNLLADWSMYVSPLAVRILPFSAKTLMFLVGPVEMLVGLAILTRWTRVGAYVASAWLAAIALNLLTTGAFFDIAVRDVVMAIAAFTLASLTEVRESANDASASRFFARPAHPAASA